MTRIGEELHVGFQRIIDSGARDWDGLELVLKKLRAYDILSQDVTEEVEQLQKYVLDHLDDIAPLQVCASILKVLLVDEHMIRFLEQKPKNGQELIDILNGMDIPDD